MANTTITDLTAGEITNDNDCFVMDTSGGVTVKITYAELVEALQNVFVDQDTYTTGMNGKQNTLTFDRLPSGSSNNPVASFGIFNALGGKTQLVWDSAPSQGSDHGITAGGVYNAIGNTTAIQYEQGYSGTAHEHGTGYAFTPQGAAYMWDNIQQTYATQNMVTGITNSLSQTLGQAINTKQNKVIQSDSITIPASGWSNNENTVTCEHTTTNRNIIDIPTDEFAVWGDKGVYAYSETATTITFKCSETPVTDLHFKLTSMEVDTNVS